jgi:lipopolysaccharide transport system permease protein
MSIFHKGEIVKPTPSGAMTRNVIIIEPSRNLFDLELRAIWRHRELLYFLAWRDVKVRYKQTVLGAGWAILQPVINTLVFTLVFGTFAKIPSDGLPYPVFAFAALLPWSVFAQTLSRSAGSLVSNAGLITKVYFPRVLIPLASMAMPVVDFSFSLLALAGLMIWYRMTPSWNLLALPLFLLLALLTALVLGLFLSPINVRYRDVAYTVPFVVQLWMYASPVVYPVSLVPEAWRSLYSLNPMVGVIEGFRWSLLGAHTPDFELMAINAAMLLCLLFCGLVWFSRMDRTSADVI